MDIDDQVKRNLKLDWKWRELKNSADETGLSTQRQVTDTSTS